MTAPSSPPGHLLHEPHHDGSAVYVDDEAPALGSSVRVRFRSPAPGAAGTVPGDEVVAAWIRTTYDAEPTYHPCVLARTDAGSATHWWEGDLPVRNPVTHYRFLLAHRDGRQTWLTGAGPVEHDVPDAHDFRATTHPAAPGWGRDAVVYQVFPDRFARSAAADERPVPAWAVPAAWDDEVVFEPHDPRTPLQFFGGDLDGLTEHLDHVVEVGADVLYTTPVFPGESNHRYNASTFDHVDPLLGGDEAYDRLVATAHARGLRVLGDLTTNHTGDTHEWFRRALEDPDARERAWYAFRPDGSYETWMGHTTLPKVDHTDPELRAAFVEGEASIVARWLRPPHDLDGWRIDVANMTGRMADVDVNQEVARAVRRTAEDVRPDALVIGEHNHDASEDVDGDGWHGAMNYSGFSWPVWSWLRDEASPARPFGRPLAVPRRPGTHALAGLRAWTGRLGWRAQQASWNILGSHDSARIRTVVGSPEVHRVAVALQFGLPGVPMVFAGDEIGLEGVTGEDARRPMPWHRREGWDGVTLASYAALARLRRTHPALTRGGLRWVLAHDDALAFVREHPEGSVLVHAVRSAAGDAAVPAAPLGLGRGVAGRLLWSTDAGAGDLVADERGDVVLPGTGPHASVWLLPAPAALAAPAAVPEP